MQLILALFGALLLAILGEAFAYAGFAFIGSQVLRALTLGKMQIGVNYREASLAWGIGIIITGFALYGICVAWRAFHAGG